MHNGLEITFGKGILYLPQIIVNIEESENQRRRCAITAALFPLCPNAVGDLGNIAGCLPGQAKTFAGINEVLSRIYLTVFVRNYLSGGWNQKRRRDSSLSRSCGRTAASWSS